MKKEWSALKTLLISAFVGIGLIFIMYGLDTENQREYLRDKELTDGAEADWHDQLASILYSPGELHTAHFKSEINCQHCHSPGKKVASDYCISCHSKKDFQKNTESKVLQDTHIFIKEEITCFACHSEHQGLGGDISVSLDLNGHETYLKKQIREDCVKCHVSDQKRAHPNMSNETCIDCHKLENPFSFKTQSFQHTDVNELKIDENSTEFIKLPFPAEGNCDECHKPGFHVGERGFEKATPPPVEGEFDCLSCHNFTFIQ